MTSTPTTRLELQKQGTNDNPDTWGVELNEVLDVLDLAIAGKTTVALSGGTVVLTDDNYEADESRAFLINVTGTSGGIITIPSREKAYVVRNANTGSVTISNGGNFVVLPQQTAYFWTDGTNFYTIYRSWGLRSSTAAAGTSMTFDNPYPPTDIKIVLKGLSHASGSQTLDVAITEEEVYSSYQAISATTFGTSATLYGSIEIMGANLPAGLIRSTAADLTADKTLGALTAHSIAYRLSAGIVGVRIQMGGQTLDAGTVDAWFR